MRLDHQNIAKPFQNAVIEALTGTENVFVFDNSVVENEVRDYSQSVTKLCKKTAKKSLQIWGEQLNEKSLLSSLDASEQDGDASTHDLSSELSNYRLLCDALERIEPVVMMVHNAEKLSDEAVHILSRLAAFSKRRNLRCQFLLFSDLAEIDDLALMQLRVDKYYPESADKSLLSNADDGVGNSSNSRIAVTIKVAVFALIAGVLLLVGARYLQSSKQDISQQLESELQPQRSVSVVSKEEVAERRRQNRLQALHESRVRDLEFRKTLEEIEEQATRYASQEASDPVLVSKAGQKSNTPETNRTTQSVQPRNQKRPSRMSEQMLAALESSNVTKVKQLYAAGEQTDAVNEAGETALAIAVITNKQSLVKQLIEAGAAVNAKDQNGHSPLFYAAIGGSEQVSLTLLNAGAQVNNLSALNKTPLMAATHNAHNSLVELLINKGAELNLQDHSGWSALQYATWNNNLSLLELLLDKGANPSLKDNDGYDAIAIAELRGHTQAMALIRQRNAS